MSKFQMILLLKLSAYEGKMSNTDERPVRQGNFRGVVNQNKAVDTAEIVNLNSQVIAFENGYVSSVKNEYSDISGIHLLQRGDLF